MGLGNEPEKDLPETGISLHSFRVISEFLIHALWYVFGLGVAFYGVYLVTWGKNLIYGICAIVLGLTVVGIMVYEIHHANDEQRKT